jgi:quinol monooxygenase YgiN
MRRDRAASTPTRLIPASNRSIPYIRPFYRHVGFVEGDSPVRTGLSVIAYVTAKAGHQDQVRDALLDLVAETRNEKGCVNYDLHQSRENTTELAIYENWEKATDLDRHAKSAHLQTFIRVAGQLLERPADITKWSMISELKSTNR